MDALPQLATNSAPRVDNPGLGLHTNVVFHKEPRAVFDHSARRCSQAHLPVAFCTDSMAELIFDMKALSTTSLTESLYLLYSVSSLQEGVRAEHLTCTPCRTASILSEL
eukprot:1159406-Pelagomonas_calceolata.AAC.15